MVISSAGTVRGTCRQGGTRELQWWLQNCGVSRREDGFACFNSQLWIESYLGPGVKLSLESMVDQEILYHLLNLWVVHTMCASVDLQEAVTPAV